MEKLEAIIQEMEAAKFVDVPQGQELVRQWAKRISDGITDLLLQDIGDGSGAAPDLSAQPGGHDWDTP